MTRWVLLALALCAALPPPSAGQFFLAQGPDDAWVMTGSTGYSGTEISSSHYDSPQPCYEACKADGSCKAWCFATDVQDENAPLSTCFPGEGAAFTAACPGTCTLYSAITGLADLQHQHFAGCMDMAHPRDPSAIANPVEPGAAPSCADATGYEYCVYCGGSMRKTCLAQGEKCTAYYLDVASGQRKGSELDKCEAFSPSGDKAAGNCSASITVDGAAFTLLPFGSTSSPPSEIIFECGSTDASSGGAGSPSSTATTTTATTNTGSCFPEGFYANPKSWLGLDGVQCEGELADAATALAGSQKWLDSLGVGGKCQWKVDDWPAACGCLKAEQDAVAAGGTACQDCTKALYESTLTQECRKALTEVQCTNLTPEQIATLQSQLGADKAAEVIERTKFGVGIKAFFDQCQISY